MSQDPDRTPAAARPRRRLRARIVPTGEQHAVTTLELFFDLVFVFAFTQVTAFMADDLGLRGVLRGLVLFALLWFVWCSYTWLGNQARADEGVVRLAMIVAMGATFLVALAIPEAWDDEGGGISAPVVLAVALAVVRLVHLGVYAVAALGDAGLRSQLVRTAVPVGNAVALLVVGAVIGGPTQTVLWAAALVVDYTGVYLSGTDWRLPAPGHFAERYGLIVIIALGESIIAVGVGVADLPLTVPTIAAAILGLVVGVSLLWAYFGVVAYLLAHLGFRLRNVGSLNRPRAIVAVVLLLAPLAVQTLPALAALAVLAAVLVALIVFEVVHYADARAAVRAEAAQHH